MKYFNITETDTIPAVGLGTWKSNKGDVGQAVTTAIEMGYRHIDCAPIYTNEREIGESFGGALGSGQVKREDLWITSKLWNNAHAQKHVRPALEMTLKDLQLDYLDLYLIHWPVHFQANITFPKTPEEYIAPDEIPIMETWLAMEKLVKKGLIRHIGVCNFNIKRLAELKKEASIQPVMNQIELHPYLQQSPMLEYCKTNNILLTAYSPLGSGDRAEAMKKENEPSLLNHPTVVEIAEKHKCGVGQVLIAWGLSRNTVVIPKSVNPGRMAENLKSTELKLEDADIKTINDLEMHYRFVDGSFFAGPGSPYTVDGLWGE